MITRRETAIWREMTGRTDPESYASADRHVAGNTGRFKMTHIDLCRARKNLVAMTLLVAFGGPLALAETGGPVTDIASQPNDAVLGKREYSPYLHDRYPQRVFWGDTHVHTAYSTDAGMVGSRLGPEEAYRFARGEEVVSSSGVRTRLQRPLDFLVVADHAENLGLAPMIEESNPALLKTAFGQKIHGLVQSGKYWEAYGLWGQGMSTRQDPLQDGRRFSHPA